MKAAATSLLLLLAVPLAAGQTAEDPFGAGPDTPDRVQASASNQRVDLSWEAPKNGAQQYRVYVYQGGIEMYNRTANETRATFFLTNGETYAFQVAAILPDGTTGPRSNPVAATPRLENDLAYLAAGLISVWVGLFGYAAFLARKEASIDAKLERILQARFQGRSP